MYIYIITNKYDIYTHIITCDYTLLPTGPCCYTSPYVTISHYIYSNFSTRYFLLVNNFSFLVITRSHDAVYGRNLVEIDPTSLPHLSKQLRDLNNSQKTEKNGF